MKERFFKKPQLGERGYELWKARAEQIDHLSGSQHVISWPLNRLFWESQQHSRAVKADEFLILKEGI